MRTIRLLSQEERPKCEGIDDTNAFLKRFGEMLAAHRGRNVLVVAHRSQYLFQPGDGSAASRRLAKDPPLAMIGGHDHSLQVLEGGNVAERTIASSYLLTSAGASTPRADD